MFGRRNPDSPHDAPPPSPSQASDLDLDIFDGLPDIPAPEEAKPAQPPVAPAGDEAVEQLPDPAWHAPSPAILGPSVTRLLQEAEEARHRAAAAEQPPVQPVPPAPAAAITQQLSYEPPVAAPAPPPVAEPAREVAPALVVPAPQPAAPNGLAAPAPARPRPNSESVIGPDDFFDGRYRSERGVRIQGNARGSIESRQYIFVEAGAQVEADLSAEDITVSGDFKGKIVCRRRLEVTGSGRIEGQVQTSLLVVQEGGAIDGELHMRTSEPASSSESGAS